MNKQEIRGLPSHARNISLLNEQIQDSRVLWLTSQDDAPVYNQQFNPQDYFDVIIISDKKHLSKIENPDVFIYMEPTIATNGVVDIDFVFAMQDSIICLNDSVIKELKRSKYKPRNYMLSFQSSNQLKDMSPYFLLNVKNEYLGSGEKLKNIDASIETTFDAFFSEKNIYRVPVNIRTKNRGTLINKWKNV